MNFFFAHGHWRGSEKDLDILNLFRMVLVAKKKFPFESRKNNSAFKFVFFFKNKMNKILSSEFKTILQSMQQILVQIEDECSGNSLKLLRQCLRTYLYDSVVVYTKIFSLIRFKYTFSL